MTETNSDTDSETLIDEERRRILASLAGIAGAGALGVYAGAETVQAAPQGTYPKPTEPALLKLRADRVRLVERSSDPSGANDGEIWYNGSA
jgi:hypothetical protein